MLWLAGKTAAGGGGGSDFTDDFNRSNGGAGSNWNGWSGGTPQVRSNHCEAEYNFTNGYFNSTVACAGQDQFAEATLLVPTSQQCRGIYVRCGASTHGYGIRKFTFDGSWNWTKGGSSNWFGSFSATNIAGNGPTVVRIEAEDIGGGSVELRCYVGGSLVDTVTDSSSIHTGLYCGAELENYSTGCQLDDWSHGPI
jgi:hypothetical protein